MKWLSLSKGLKTCVDNDVFTWARKYSWSATGRIGREYASRKKGARGSCRTIYLHREILRPEGKLEVLHKNGNALDNRRQNLRLGSRSENLYGHQFRPSSRSSRFRNVAFHKATGRWECWVHISGKKVHLGFFRSEKKAAKVRDCEALKRLGPCVYLNFPI